MSNLLTRLAGLIVLAAGLACLRAIPAVVRIAYENGPGASPAAGVAIFFGCAAAAFVLVLVSPPLILGGLYATIFRLRAAR